MTGKRGISGQLKSHVYEDPNNVTPELISEMTKLCRMKRPKELQPSFMLGYLDPYENFDEMKEGLKALDEKNIQVKNVMSEKIFGR